MEIGRDRVMQGVGVLIAVYFFATRLPSQLDVILPLYHPRLAVLNSINSYSFLDHGIQTYFFNTYAESQGGLHLYALFGAPLIAILGPPGLRWFGLFLTAITLPVVYGFVKMEYDRPVALTATAAVCASPMFLWFGGSIFPEAFELLFSAVAIAGYALYRRIVDYRVLAGSLLALSLAIVDHFWAAYAVAPIVWCCLRNRDWRLAALYSVVTLVVTGTGYWIRQLAPGGGSVIRAYSIIHHWDYYLDSAFYFDLWYNIFGFAFSPVLIIPILFAAVYYFLRQEHELIAVWFLASLSIPFVFPRGVSNHFYYVWGAIVPGSILLALLIRDIATLRYWERAGLRTSQTYSIGASGAIALLVLSAFIVGGPTLSVAPFPNAEGLDEGAEIAEVMEANEIESDEVAVLTVLNADRKEAGNTLFLHTYLVYGELYLMAPGSPTVYESRQVAAEDGVQLIIDVRGSYVETMEPGDDPEILVRTEGNYQHVSERS